MPDRAGARLGDRHYEDSFEAGVLEGLQRAIDLMYAAADKPDALTDLTLGELDGYDAAMSVVQREIERRESGEAGGGP